MSGVTDRFTRQAGLVPRDRMTDLSVTVIGVGAIGRQVALQLAAIGVPRMHLIDFDTVDMTNVTTQGYHAGEIGQLKIVATRDEISRIDPTIEVTIINDRFRPRHRVGDAVFACVDLIAARAAIWRSVRNRSVFWADGRMLGEIIRVLSSDSPPTDQSYEQTLFAPDQAEPGTCTSRSTVYAASVASSLMVHQFTRWLRRIPVDRQISLNLLASELVVS